MHYIHPGNFLKILMPSPHSQRLWFSWVGSFKKFSPGDYNVQLMLKTTLLGKVVDNESYKKHSEMIFLKNMFASSLCQRRLSNLILAPLMLESDCKPLNPLGPWLTSPGFCFHNRCPQQTPFSLMQNSSTSWIFIRISHAGRFHDLL